MLTILVAGVVAELVMLPALLAGPLGKGLGRGPRSASRMATPAELPRAISTCPNRKPRTFHLRMATKIR